MANCLGRHVCGVNGPFIFADFEGAGRLLATDFTFTPQWRLFLCLLTV